MATVESMLLELALHKLPDARIMHAADVHLGTKNADPQIKEYIAKCRDDGIYIINLFDTWDKLLLAAREIVAIENPQNIFVRSARPYGQRAVLKFAQYTGAHAIAGRHTPGTFTNQLQTSFGEPRLLIVTDPITDHQHIEEAALANIRTIAFCDTDSPMRNVDIVIPANNKGKRSIGCLFWLLARMVLQMRGTIPLGLKWDVRVDLFFYREPEEAMQPEEDEIAAPDYAIADFNASAIGGDILCPVVIDQPCPDVPVNWSAPKTVAAGDCGEAVPPPQLGLDNGRVWEGSGPNQQTIPIRGWKKRTQIRPGLGFGLCGCGSWFMRFYGSVQRDGRIRKTVFAKRNTAKKRRMKMN